MNKCIIGESNELASIVAVVYYRRSSFAGGQVSSRVSVWWAARYRQTGRPRHRLARCGRNAPMVRGPRIAVPSPPFPFRLPNETPPAAARAHKCSTTDGRRTTESEPDHNPLTEV